MRYSLFWVWVLWVSPCLSYGQRWELIKEVEVENTDDFTLDQDGNIYLTAMNGAVAKYSRDGILLYEYAPMQSAKIQKIMATSQLKVILFYEDLQEYVLLNRFLALPVRYRLSDFEVGYVEDLTTNFQQSVWLIDISDFSMKLYDARENRLLSQNSLAQILQQNQAEILCFYNHQNRMYLVDRHIGVLVFDNLGNYLTTLTDAAPERIGFDKDYLYFSEGEQLKFIHLYEDRTHALRLPEMQASKAGYSGGRLVLFTPGGFKIYQYLSGK